MITRFYNFVIVTLMALTFSFPVHAAGTVPANVKAIYVDGAGQCQPALFPQVLQCYLAWVTAQPMPPNWSLGPNHINNPPIPGQPGSVTVDGIFMGQNRGTMFGTSFSAISVVTSCPVDSTPLQGTTNCSCTDPAIPNANQTACLKPSYLGATDTICTASGCTTITYNTPQAACDSLAMANQTTTLVQNNICKIVTTYADGTSSTVYKTITNTNACAAGDTACFASLNASNPNAPSFAASYASNVAAVTSQAAKAAYDASISQGATSSVAAAAAQAAAAQAASSFSTQGYFGGGAGGSANSPAPANQKLPIDYNRENTQLKILADLDRMAIASGATATVSMPANLAKTADVNAVTSAVNALKDSLAASGVPSDISTVDATTLANAETARKQFQNDILSIPTGADPVAAPSLLNPFTPGACAPLSFTFGSALMFGQHTVTLDVCPWVPTIQRVLSYALYLLTAVLLFQMFTRRPDAEAA